MEVEALSRYFPPDRASPLLLGAVCECHPFAAAIDLINLQNKTNLGHSEAASGISAVIKTVLAFEHNQIPATIGVRDLNPKCKIHPLQYLNKSSVLNRPQYISMNGTWKL